MIYIAISAAIFALLINGRQSLPNRANILTIVIVRDYFLLSAMGYIYYYNDEKYLDHYLLLNMVDDRPIVTAFYAATYFILLFAVSFKIFQAIFSSIVRQSSWNFPVHSFKKWMRWFVYIQSALFIYFGYKYKASIFGISGNDVEALTYARAGLEQGGGILRLLKIMTASWLPMSSYIWFMMFLTERDKFRRSDYLALALAMIMGSLAVIWSFEKSRLAFYLFGFFGVWVYAGRTVKMRSWIIMIAVALSSVMFGYLVTYGDRVTDFDYLTAIIEHRVMTQSVGSIAAFDLYPHYLPFKGFSGISNFLASITGGTFASPYSEIIDFLVPEYADVSGAMSSFATGEAYALFGITGVAIAPFLAAVYYGAIEATNKCGSSKVLWVALYATFFATPFLASSFYSFFWPIGFLFSMLPFLILAMFAQMSRSREV